MRILMPFMLLAVGMAVAVPQPGKQSGPSAKVSLTGCVDEHDGHYILTNDTTLEPKASLRPAAGSAEDNFARYVGQKVSVRGRLAKEPPLPVMTVESLKPVSETCAPAGEQRQ